MAIVRGDVVRSKKGDELYEEEFAGRTAIVTEVHREWGGIVATVQFDGGGCSSFYAAGLRRVRPTPGTVGV